MAHLTSIRWLPLLAALSTTLPTLAQPDTRPPASAPGDATAPPPDAPPDTPTPARPAPASRPEPQLPEVDDPMLRPVPPAPHRLTSWQQALRRVREQTSSLRISAAQVEQAAAQSRLALAQALPTLTGTAGIQRHLLMGEGWRQTSAGFERGTVPDPATTWNAGLQLRVPVFAPRAWHDAKTARRAERSARLTARESERLAIAATADAIVSAVTAERLAEVSRVSLRSGLSTLGLTRRRARVGAARAFDVLRAEQEVALTRAQIVAADESVRLTREALGLTVGSSEPYGVPHDISLDSLATDAAQSCRPEQSVDRRPDVVAARAQVDVAERNVDSVDWAFLPTVDVVSNLDYLSSERRSANSEHVTWSVGALLTWQLYDGGVRYGTRDANRAQLSLAREQLTQAKRVAEVEVVRAQRAVRVAEANLEVSRRTRDLASQSARLARIAFVTSNGTSFDLIDAAKRLREAEIDLTVKEFELVRAKVMALLALSTCTL
jgi:outer membrane protein TolC